MILKEKEYCNIDDLNRDQIAALMKELGFVIDIGRGQYIRRTPQYLKDKLKLGTEELYKKYYYQSFFMFYDLNFKNGIKAASSKKMIAACKKHNIPTVKFIGSPQSSPDGCGYVSEDYVEIYLLDDKVTSAGSDLYNEIVNHFDFQTVELLDANEKPFKKVIPITKKEYLKLKLQLSDIDMKVFLISNTFNIRSYLDVKMRQKPKIKNIIKKYVKPTYIKTGSYYTIHSMGNREGVVFAEDYGWMKA